MIKVLILCLLYFHNNFAFDLDDAQYDKIPPLFSLDNYHSCLLNNGTYCLVKVELLADSSNKLLKLLKSYTESSLITHYNHTYQEKGICVSRTCRKFIDDKNLDSQSDLQDVLDKCNNETTFAKYGLEARVSDIFYCDKKSQKEDNFFFDWAVLTLLLIIILVNVTATIYDLMLDENSRNDLTKGQKILLCFSLRMNWKYLFSTTKSNPDKPSLDGINFVRVSASYMMVLGHVVWVHTMGFIDNPHDFERSYKLPHYQVIYNGMIVVQIFFVLSGFLLINNIQPFLDKHSRSASSWKLMSKIFFVRYLRLIPSLSVMLAFTATWMRFMGSGPLWNRYVTPVVGDCKKYWWTHLLFINNYVKENKFCAIQTWHIAADTQILILAISAYLLTKKHWRMTMLWVLLLLSFVPPALHVFFQDLNAMLIKSPEFLRDLEDINFNESYVFGHNNMSCFILGMITAVKLYEWQKKRIVFKGKLYVLLFRLCVPVIVFCFFAGCMFYQEDSRTPLWIRIIYQSTHRFIFGLPTAYMIIGFGMNIDRVFGDFMRWPGFAVLARLTYSVYLLHMNFVPLIAGSKTQLEHFYYLTMIVQHMGIVLLSYALSIPFFLMVEAPVDPLIKVLLNPSKKLKDEKMDGNRDILNENQDNKKVCEERNGLYHNETQSNGIKKNH
ncbi:nose resistant to fluoxetine protein 6 [Amyelois transitella]|uniref:nose resistant to fluoxetine protein 6 n=1 Tax=Amyelois transitella TaxID=680683 RepID=UPI00298F50A7|nr:nose resistant to fluoxetine protein 6 [Amyelois transitella]